MADQIVDKRSVGIPDPIVFIRQDIERIYNDTKQLLADAAEAERRREAAEARRESRIEAIEYAERVRKSQFDAMMRLLSGFSESLKLYRLAIDTLGSIHTEHDYMWLVGTLHMSDNAVSLDEDGVPTFLQAELVDGELSFDGDFVGIN